jgi:hypothetical protein
LKAIEELRIHIRHQIGVLIVQKEKQQAQVHGSKKTFLTSEIMQAIVKFDSQWSMFEEEFLMKVKEPRGPGEAEVLQQFACLMGDCIAYLLQSNLITQDMVNDFDPALLVCLPRIMVLR